MSVCNRLQMKIPFFLWLLLLPLSKLLFGIHASLASGVCLSGQQSLLIQLHRSLVFNRLISTKLVGWNFSADCCEWAGVICDGGGLGRVTGLNLSNESISGGLENSNALFSLQYLQNLDLSVNNFNTSIPESFASLPSLVSLNLSNTGFVGQIPVAISRMTTLATLDLSSGFCFFGHGSLKLENPDLPTLVQNLTRLTDLHLDCVNISSHGNEWCQALSSSLPNLQVLSLSNCFLSGPFDSSLEKLLSLSVIRLNGNNLSAPVPQFFANFSNLTTLSLSGCNLQEKFPPEVLQGSTLEILDLSYNPELWGYLPDGLQNASSLRILVLSNTNFSGSLPDSIGTLGNLSRIELAACNFSGLIPMSMAKLTELVYLDFSSNSFTGPIPSFSRSKQLVYVDFSHNQLSGEILSTHFEGLWNLLYIDFRFNSLSGSIPPSLFAIPSLQKIQLSFNQFTGQLPEFSGASSSSLDTLDLSSNKLEGPIPISIFDIKRLNVLLLSSNKFNGTIQLDRIQKLCNLTSIDLSYNNLTVESASNSTSSSFPQISTLRLASCKLRVFPDLSNQSFLTTLDLSDNQITGVIPRWIWKVGNGSLLYLNLSHNLLEDLEQPHYAPNLLVLDLHYNRLKGQIPTFPPFSTYVDYSSNNFTSVIPDNFGTNLSVAIFFSLSNNSLTGVIPESICNATSLQVLDLSDNGLNGRIPSCLIERSKNLGVLNLRRNNFRGNIPDNFPANCNLKTLDVSRNLLEGKVPQSLIKCTTLEVLNLGNNKFKDTFPCLLMNISSLRVLVLRQNTFHGDITCQQTNVTWTRLQIIDIASNNFSGRLPNTILSSWKAMMGDGNGISDHLKVTVARLSELYYQDSITVISKGLEMNLVKILTIFTSIDVSHNKFEGLIPENLGQLNSLIVLNLSHNALVGQIPSALGNISHLESLDLSDNKLTGEIPQQLADLTFLSVLNLSYNKLVGKIPTSTQLQSFSASSFANNKGLCGPPLTKTCTNISTVSDFPPIHGAEIKWNYLSIELGYIFGLGIVVLPLMLWKRWRICYYKHIDGIIVKMFPKLGDRTRNQRKRC
ncbi:receptor like protein 27 [Manihot esculenta]|uniref:Leucine-rich repeat-containing N-terminal plant-type domain-containing protein n=1 Tax=Manihot esculenta TaxID=3983 RepID=A0A2C9VEU2_MANES|nr:receptor like protein 27 [Manihot esculenta]OAY43746.1 hypothetical protein MANES_08G094500v8 [Manihot esculenta]